MRLNVVGAMERWRDHWLAVNRLTSTSMTYCLLSCSVELFVVYSCAGSSAAASTSTSIRL